MFLFEPNTVHLINVYRADLTACDDKLKYGDKSHAVS